MAAAKSDIETDRLQHLDHHFVHVPRMQPIAFRFSLGEQRADVKGGLSLRGLFFLNRHISHPLRLARPSGQSPPSANTNSKHRIYAAQTECTRVPFPQITLARAPCRSRVACSLRTA